MAMILGLMGHCAFLALSVRLHNLLWRLSVMLYKFIFVSGDKLTFTLQVYKQIYIFPVQLTKDLTRKILTLQGQKLNRVYPIFPHLHDTPSGTMFDLISVYRKLCIEAHSFTNLVYSWDLLKQTMKNDLKWNSRNNILPNVYWCSLAQGKYSFLISRRPLRIRK